MKKDEIPAIREYRMGFKEFFKDKPKNDKELKKHQKELSKVINYSKILEEVDTNGVEETAQTTGLINVFRKDKIKKSLSQKEALSNAKKTYNGYFKVPKILEHA